METEDDYQPTLPRTEEAPAAEPEETADNMLDEVREVVPVEAQENSMSRPTTLDLVNRSEPANLPLVIEQPTPVMTVNPSKDLLEWCQDVTRGYSGVRITNMTTSWRNGLAFCAILHRFRPELMLVAKCKLLFSLFLNLFQFRNFDSLSSQDIRGNCKLAFETGEKLGIPRVIEPADMVSKILNLWWKYLY